MLLQKPSQSHDMRSSEGSTNPRSLKPRPATRDPEAPHTRRISRCASPTQRCASHRTVIASHRGTGTGTYLRYLRACVDAFPWEAALGVEISASAAGQTGLDSALWDIHMAKRQQHPPPPVSRFSACREFVRSFPGGNDNAMDCVSGLICPRQRGARPLPSCKVLPLLVLVMGNERKYGGPRGMYAMYLSTVYKYEYE